MLNDKVWIIIPAYNEQNSIRSVLNNLLGLTKNIVVVDDASADLTKNWASSLGVYVISHEINRGQGAALQTGTEFALTRGAEIIVHFDADGQMQTKDIPAMIAPLLEGKADIVLGSRFLGQASHVPWTKKYFIHKPAILFNWLFTGIKLTDVHNGFRALSQKSATAIEINLDGMAHATEILDQVRRCELLYQEVPVDILYHEYGQGFFKGFKIIKDLILARLIRK